jgi:hypothetical protein
MSIITIGKIEIAGIGIKKSVSGLVATLLFLAALKMADVFFDAVVKPELHSRWLAMRRRVAACPASASFEERWQPLREPTKRIPSISLMQGQ